MNLRKGSDVQKGFTLLELMIASFLGMFVINLLLHVLLNTIHNYYYALSLMRMTDNGRFLSQLLLQDINDAGYMGCGKWQDVFFINHTPLRIPQGAGVVGLNADTAQYFPSNMRKKMRAQTDALLITKGQGHASMIYQGKKNSKQLAIFLAIDHYHLGDYIIVSDCKSAEILQIMGLESTANTTTLELNAPLAFNYTSNATIHKLQQIIYFVGPVSYETKTYALFRQEVFTVQKPQAIADGIDFLAFRYNSSSGHELLSTQIQDWRTVTAVHALWLLDSLTVLTTKGRTYQFLNQDFINHDGHLYKQWDLLAPLQIPQ